MPVQIPVVTLHHLIYPHQTKSMLACLYRQVRTSVVKTGNVRIDAILNSKLGVARSKGIDVSATAFVPKKMPISEEVGLIIRNPPVYKSRNHVPDTEQNYRGRELASGRNGCLTVDYLSFAIVLIW